MSTSWAALGRPERGVLRSTLAGYFLADAYQKTREVIGPIGTILFAAVVLLLVVRFIRRQRAAS